MANVKVIEWRDIPGYEGLYQASNYGTIMSMPREWIGPKGLRKIGGIVLKPCILSNGYHQVCLYKNKKSAKHSTHSLVMLTFVGPRPDGYSINHIDGHKQNNRIDNLEYCTYAQNNTHAIETGLRDPKAINKQQSNFIADSTVYKARELFDGGLRICEVARQLNIHPGIIQRIVRRKSYAWL
ncbi:MAG: Slash 96 [Spirosoma sp.]|nr:Slash 96 [Spirosoma sp.]